MKLKYLISIFICLFMGVISVSAQRVFVVSETGFVKEAPQGEVKKFMMARSAILKEDRPIILPNPLKIYLNVGSEFDPDEWYVCNLMRHKKGVGDIIFSTKDGKNAKKSVSFNRISDDIIEISFNETYNSALKEIVTKFKNGHPVTKGIAHQLPEIVVAYEPNKQHKKEGKESKYWFAGLSDNSYDKNNVSWTSSQIESSINEILATKNSSNQLFASIVPQPAPQILASNGNVQYIVVQNNNVQQSLAQQQSVSPQIETKIPDSDVDIDIPYGIEKSENSFALVIANEDYKKVSSVPFAIRDGQKVKEYLVRTLGFDKAHVTLLENATLNDMRYELSKLSKISEAYKGDMSLVVYYCGHGIPDEKNGNGYLLPVDGYGTDVSTAYSTQELYDFLGSLNVKKTLLFMDACFSGASKDGDMLVAARGIAIKSRETTPTGNLIAFSACQGDETAYPFKEKGHGLMTYYLLKKLQDTKGKVSLGELADYLNDNVTKTAIVTNGKPQTPSVGVSPNLQETWKNSRLVE